MGLLGDRAASLVQLHREVHANSPDDVHETAERIIAAVGPVHAPVIGSKVYLRREADQIAFVYGNKVTEFWIVAVSLRPSPGGGAAVWARCLRCQKGREVSNFLHETMKPVLDAIERSAETTDVEEPRRVADAVTAVDEFSIETPEPAAGAAESVSGGRLGRSMVAVVAGVLAFLVTTVVLPLDGALGIVVALAVALALATAMFPRRG